MKEEIENTLKLLINMCLKEIGRAGDLEWFLFNVGEKFKSMNWGEQPPSEYTLHAECPWRIVGPEGIIVGSQDRFYPAGGDPYLDLMEFEWDVPGSNRCDERVSHFVSNNAEKPLIVSSIEADQYGSLSIRLSGGHSLDLFPDNSLRGEFWRFFKLGDTSSHFVVTGEGAAESSD